MMTRILRALARLAGVVIDAPTIIVLPDQRDTEWTARRDGSLLARGDGMSAELYPAGGGWVWVARTGAITRSQFHQRREDAVAEMQAAASDFALFARQ